MGEPANQIPPESDPVSKQFAELLLGQNVFLRNERYNHCMDLADNAKSKVEDIRPDPRWPLTGIAIVAAKLLVQPEVIRSALCEGVVNMTLAPSDVPLQRIPKKDASSMRTEVPIER